MGTPSSMQIRITSSRDRPVSLASSAGLRWFAIPCVLLRASKSPTAQMRSVGPTRRSLVADGGQRARLPKDSMVVLTLPRRRDGSQYAGPSDGIRDLDVFP